MIYLILLFTVVPVAELMLLFEAGDLIGGLNTVALVILTGVVGASMAKSQGLSLFAQIQSQMQRGEIPAEKLLQGFLVFGGGLLLMTPGFMTDILGFCMVLPGPRAIFAQLVKLHFARKVQMGHVHIVRGPFSQGRNDRPMDFQASSMEDLRAEFRRREEKVVKEAHVTEVRDVTDSIKPQDEK